MNTLNLISLTSFFHEKGKKSFLDAVSMFVGNPLNPITSHLDFNGSVIIPESCDFSPQFDPLNIIF